MENKTVDNLNIQISADAQKAKKALETFTTTLEKVNKAFGNINSSGLATFSKKIGNLSYALTQLSDSKPDVSGLNKTMNALGRLAKVDMGKFDPIAFSELTQSIKTLSDMPDISSNASRFVSSLSRIANAGKKTTQSAKGIKKLGKGIKKAANDIAGAKRISDDANLFTQSIGRLANAGAKTAQTADGLKKLAEETLKFFEAMQGAPQISDNTLKMTQALAQLASSGGRVGTTTNSVSQAMNKLANVTSKSGSKVKNTVKSMIDSFTGLEKSSKSINRVSVGIGSMIKGALFFKAQDVLTSFGGNMFELGSAITEVENVVDTAFGSMAYKAYDFAETAAEQFGISELAAKNYAGTMMAVLNSSGVKDKEVAAEMSTTLAGLAGDLASFYNISQDVAWERIMSGMAGEVEPLRRLGINLSVANLQAYALSQGITKSWQSMTQAEQVMLRYNYLMELTGAQQGDFARTSGKLCAA